MAGTITKESFLKELEPSRFNKLLEPGVRQNLINAIRNVFDDTSLQGVYDKFRAEEDKLIAAENEEEKKEERKLEKIEEMKRLKENDKKDRLESEINAQQLIDSLNRPVISALRKHHSVKILFFLILAGAVVLIIAALIYRPGFLW